MGDVLLSKELFNYAHEEASGDFAGLDIQIALMKDHAWLKSRNKYLESDRVKDKQELSELKALYLELVGWMEVNLDLSNGYLECRGDEDCDHCHGISILHDHKEAIERLKGER